MSFTATIRPYEALFRWSPDGEVSAQVQHIREITDDGTGETVSAKELPPAPLATAGSEFDAIVSQIDAAAHATIAARDAEIAALTAERDALVARVAALEAQLPA